MKVEWFNKGLKTYLLQICVACEKLAKACMKRLELTEFKTVSLFERKLMTLMRWIEYFNVKCLSDVLTKPFTKLITIFSNH